MFCDIHRFYTDEGILQINNVSHRDEGLYTCIARTSLDQVTASAYVTVLGMLFIIHGQHFDTLDFYNELF